jgi:hypothetical protein
VRGSFLFSRSSIASSEIGSRLRELQSRLPKSYHHSPSSNRHFPDRDLLFPDRDLFFPKLDRVFPDRYRVFSTCDHDFPNSIASPRSTSDLSRNGSNRPKVRLPSPKPERILPKADLILPDSDRACKTFRCAVPTSTKAGLSVICNGFLFVAPPFRALATGFPGARRPLGRMNQLLSFSSRSWRDQHQKIPFWSRPICLRPAIHRFGRAGITVLSPNPGGLFYFG